MDGDDAVGGVLSTTVLEDTVADVTVSVALAVVTQKLSAAARTVPITRNEIFSHLYECAETCRVNFGGSYDNTMCSNGLLDEEYTWQDVHNLVEEVKEKMEL